MIKFIFSLLFSINSFAQTTFIQGGSLHTNSVAPISSTINMNSAQLNSVADPTHAQDAATDNWVTSNFANQQLSNVSGTTSIPVALLPSTTGSINLGSISENWYTTFTQFVRVGSTPNIDVYNQLLYNIAGNSATINYGQSQLTNSSNSVFDWSHGAPTTGYLDAKINQLANVVDPSHAQDAATDNWVTNNFQANGNYITALTGDVTASGPGSSVATLAATSNSTLTTLSSLSLPTSQLSGNISLTSQVSGVLPIANGGTNNGSLAVTAGGVIYTDGTKLVNVGAGTSGYFLESNGASAPSWAASSFTPRPPTFQSLTSGSGTYTPPTSPAPLYIKVRVVGGGGGGAGGGVVSTAAGGSNGSSTTFGSVITAGFGNGGNTNGGRGGTGGTPSSSITTLASFPGGGGSAGGSADPGGGINISNGGGTGGMNPFGGAGPGGAVSDVGLPGATNTGAGGGGGGNGSNGANAVYPGAGGGAGAYIEALILSIAPSYAYSIGTGGAGGAGGTSGGAGGAGADGIIIIEEYYQ